MRIRTPTPLQLASLLAVALLVGWVFRSKVEHFLAPAESDYTPDSQLDPFYPRPGADLTPVWKAEVEAGYGGAAIDAGEVFVLDRKVGVSDTLRVFDLETGEERWSYEYEAPGRLEFSGSRTTPVVVDELVYLLGSFGRVHCLDRRTHAVVWSLDLEDDCGGALPDFGWTAAPLVHGALVILPALGDEVGLVACDRFTGELAWRTAAVGHSHSTPVLLELLGERHLLFLSTETQGLGEERPAPTTISGFDPETGGELWSTTTLLTSVPVPPPVRVDDERFFITGGYSGGSTLLRIDRTDSGYSLEEVFHVEKGAQLHPPVVHEGHIYMLANENSNEARRGRDQGGLTCLDLNGNEIWSTGSDPYFGRGHMLLLGKHLLIQDGLSGMLRMCVASPDGYAPVATANVFEVEPKARKRMWAPMSREGGTLVVRGQTELRCVRLGDRSRE